ncbi:type 2 isopentenyl-diphosphate Delta-isomerase [Candidatus Bathyarchaeota archaeon]|nr:type 2 isopentenyl-diphosphate Delta-isomerase [Candidatus Bathyarchaeota archaeon]
MGKQTENRKAEHISICLDKKAQARKATTGFEDVQFVHRALPEVDKAKIDVSTTVFGHKFSAPLIVGAMTGGTTEATRINAAIAEAVESLQLGMGVGSQRAAIENPKLAETFSVTRKKAPTAFLIANIGGIQLVHGCGVKEMKQAVEMIDADAVAVHLNALHEAVQPEGQTSFKGVLNKICEVAGELDKPVIVKETGAGIAAEDAKKLERAGVKALDVGGAGGTSFAAVEYYRSEAGSVQRFLGDVFWDWGIPTATSLIETAQTIKIPVIASGGLRSGMDVAKSLALNACLGSVCQPALEAAVKGGKATEKLLSRSIDELKTVMFLVGAEKVEDLAKTPVVVTGKTAEWFRARGFNVEEYARRGAH